MSSKGTKRPRRKNPKYVTDNALTDELKKTSTKWCRVLCIEDNKMHIVSSDKLRTEDKDFVTVTDLTRENRVLWQYSGIPYEVKIIDVFDKKPMPGDLKKEKKSICTHFVEDSSSDEDLEDIRPSKKSKSTHFNSQEHFVIDTSESESDSGISQAVTPSSLANPALPLVPLNLPADPTANKKESDSGISQAMTISSPSSLANPALPPLSLPAEPTADNKELHQLMKTVLQKVENILTILLSDGKAPKTCLPMGSASVVADGDKFISENGVDLLAIKAAEADKYALALMEALFTDEELACSCYSATSRSTKKPLPKEKIELLEECVDKKFGKGTTEANIQKIRRKCNQKCIDIANKKIKKKPSENT